MGRLVLDILERHKVLARRSILVQNYSKQTLARPNDWVRALPKSLKNLRRSSSWTTPLQCQVWFFKIALASLAIVCQIPFHSSEAMEYEGRLPKSATDSYWSNGSWPIPADRKNDFDAEAEVIARLPSTAHRWSNLLSIKLRDGYYMKFVDIGDPGISGYACCEYYRLKGFLPDETTFFIEVNSGESSEVLAVSSNAGIDTPMIAFPSQNVDYPQFFLSVRLSEIQGSAVEIWEYDLGTWVSRYSCRRMLSGLTSATWRGLDVELTYGSGSGDARNLIQFKNGSWVSLACNTSGRY